MGLADTCHLAQVSDDFGLKVWTLVTMDFFREFIVSEEVVPQTYGHGHRLLVGGWNSNGVTGEMVGHHKDIFGSTDRKSMQISSSGRGVWMLTRGVACSSWDFRSTHLLQVLMLFATSIDILGQKNLDQTRCRVLSMPR